MFILSQIIDNVLKTDLRKAYDSVWREGLWRVFEESGLNSKLVNIIKRLYKGHRSRVVTIGGLTDLYCTIGMKQGWVPPPILFALFVAGLEQRQETWGYKLEINVWVAYCLQMTRY